MHHIRSREEESRTQRRVTEEFVKKLLSDSSQKEEKEEEEFNITLTVLFIHLFMYGAIRVDGQQAVYTPEVC